ncbi:MAG TPA: PfkB family carbohydrate kinase [Chthonomonadales bacterium]|nr:PfkB family carbohydrate kinase [Chthonomonadales bacterium]
MTPVRLREIVGAFAGARVLCVGDLMMDEYVWGRATRISPESPVMVVEVDRETSVPGGAANVVHNLLALGAAVAVAGVVGDDAAGAALRARLGEEGADVSGVLADPGRPTTRKTRVVAHHQQVLRVDRERAAPLQPEVRRRLEEEIEGLAREADAIVVSDYDKGVVCASTAAVAVEAGRRRGAPVTANAKPRNAQRFAGASLVSLNAAEADAVAGASAFSAGEGLEEAGRALREILGIDALVVTRGADGIALWEADGVCRRVPAHPVEVYDVAGAGDTVISVLTLGLARSVHLVEAAEVASLAAAAVVRKVGVAVVTARELLGADG